MSWKAARLTVQNLKLQTNARPALWNLNKNTNFISVSFGILKLCKIMILFHMLSEMDENEKYFF